MSDEFKLGAVVLKVADLAKMAAFYAEVIGLVKQAESEEKVLFGAKNDGDTLLVLEKLTNGVRPNMPRTGLFHTAFLVPNRAALGDMLIHLIKSKYPLSGAGDHAYSEAIYLADPEGNGIEIYRDRPFAKWRINEDGTYPAVTEEVDADAIIDAATREEFHQIHPETKIGHVHLQVSDIEATEEFYGNILGLNIQTKIPSARFFAEGRYHHHIGSNIWAGTNLLPRAENETGLAYFTIVTSKFKEWETRLAKAGFKMEKRHFGVQVSDPNGILIMLQEPQI
ncbi:MULTISPECIES: VOC family protein [Listeria]|uniref:VOC family protein n=1 Tax=Listeria TaxID=1637 RepID=UPI000B589256|nr:MULTISPECIES: VOC family protein [Listeria]